MAQQPSWNWRETIPHLIVLALLVLVLLVVVTKFKRAHCTAIPGWCDVYCSLFGNSKVAVITGAGAIGNTSLLLPLVQRAHPITLVEPFPAEQMSLGLLEPYELVVVEGVKNFSLKQRVALLDYLDRGGSLLLVGDAVTEFYVSPEDLDLARLLNATNPGYYERVLNESRRAPPGFGELGESYVGADYVRTEPAQPATLKVVARGHPLVKGLREEFPLGNASGGRVPFAVVTEQPRAVTKVAVLRAGGREYPALLEAKYVGRIVYFAFPPELAGSPTLLANVFDYLVTC
jgi:hypothetical protein